MLHYLIKDWCYLFLFFRRFPRQQRHLNFTRWNMNKLKIVPVMFLMITWNEGSHYYWVRNFNWVLLQEWLDSHNVEHYIFRGWLEGQFLGFYICNPKFRCRKPPLDLEFGYSSILRHILQKFWIYLLAKFPFILSFSYIIITALLTEKGSTSSNSTRTKKAKGLFSPRDILHPWNNRKT